MGLFSNPLNWQLSKSLTGRQGGINPVKAVVKYTSPIGFAGDAIKDAVQSSGSGFQGAGSGEGAGGTGGGGWGDGGGNGTPDGSTGTTSTGSGGGSYDPNELALFDQAINEANQGFGLLDEQKRIGVQNVNDSYQTALQKLLNQSATAERDYNTSRNQTITDNVAAKSNIDTQVGRNVNALQRLLGSRGAGSSSAARFSAPLAAAQAGTQQRTQVQDAFARNLSGLDTGYEDYTRGVGETRQELDNQKTRETNAVESAFLGGRNSLLAKLAELSQKRTQLLGGDVAGAGQSFLDQIRTNNNTITGLGAQFANRVQAVAPEYAEADLEAYDFDKPNLGAGQSGFLDTISPAYSSLFGKKRDQFGL